MQSEGLRGDQVTQVRGFADQHLRKLETPLDASNRRISLIVQYMQKAPEPEASDKKEEGSTAGHGEKPKPADPLKESAKPKSE